MNFDPAGVARQAVEQYVRSGRRLSAPAVLADEFKVRAGVFVSIKRAGELRGCIGTITPCHETLYEEIIENAIDSASKDPRFRPISPGELDGLAYSVDILSPPEPVNRVSDLDPKNYGVIVRSRGRVGLLLPDLEGVDSAEQQLMIARRKAGIFAGEPIEILRFGVDRFPQE